MKQELTIEIDSEGEQVTLEVSGHPGKQCLEVTRVFEAALGKIISRQHTREYFLKKAGIHARITPSRGGGT